MGRLRPREGHPLVHSHPWSKCLDQEPVPRTHLAATGPGPQKGEVRWGCWEGGRVRGWGIMLRWPHHRARVRAPKGASNPDPGAWTTAGLPQGWGRVKAFVYIQAMFNRGTR